MATIAQLRTDYTARLNALATVHGENTNLSDLEQSEVSSQMDEVVETWNPNLPPRPTS